MNLFKLSWKNIVHRPLSSGLSVLLLAAGISIILITVLTSHQIDEKFKKNIEGIDLVIGAKGSRLQLVLCNIFHVDNPTGNINYARTGFLRMHPFVEKAIPLSLGDNYQSYRIVGTTEDYIDLYDGKILQGKLWNKPMQAVIGASIAEKFYLNIGDRFASGHGLGESTHSHNDMLYEIVGVLEKNNTVLDNLVLTSLESVWIVHAGESHQSIGSFDVKTIDDFGGDSLALDSFLKNQPVIAENEHHDHDHHHDHNHAPILNYDSILQAIDPLTKEITAMLVSCKTIKGKFTIPGVANNTEGMMAADVAIEMQLLDQLIAPAIGVMEMLAYIVMLIAAISMFVAMFNSLKDREYEVALMRVMGASAFKVFFSILIEGLLLSLMGFLSGWLLSHLGMMIFSSYLTEMYHYDFSGWVFVQEELYLLVGAIIIGIVSAFYPAYKTYLVDISNTLSK